MPWRSRVVWTVIYGCAAFLLWVFADYEMRHIGVMVAGMPSGGTSGGAFLATPGFAYLGALICGVLSFLALIGRLPHVPEDEPL